MRIAIESPAQPEVVELIESLDAFQRPLYPGQSHPGAALGDLCKPNVLFSVARAATGKAIACGAMVLEDQYGELKRMYTKPEHRGQRIATSMLSFLEAQAIARGIRSFKLETGCCQPDAIGLYVSCGYARCGPFGSYREDPDSVYLQKSTPTGHSVDAISLPLASLRTASLLLAPFEQADVTALFAIMRDSSAMQHTYVAPSLDDCLSRLSGYEAARATLGFAPWVVRTAGDHRVIGWGGLSVDPEEPKWGIEVSYALAPSAWGRGFATELVRASLAQAFGPLQVQQVHAFARPANKASVRVLEKSGFAYLRYEPILERGHYVVTAHSAA